MRANNWRRPRGRGSPSGLRAGGWIVLGSFDLVAIAGNCASSVGRVLWGKNGGDGGILEEGERPAQSAGPYRVESIRHVSQMGFLPRRESGLEKERRAIGSDGDKRTNVHIFFLCGQPVNNLALGI